MSNGRISFGAFAFDPARGILTREGIPLTLGARAIAILTALLEAGNRIVTKDELVDAAWPGAAIEESNLSVQVAGLRKLLGTQPDGSDWIVTVPRAGYRFAGRIDAPATASPARPVVAVHAIADAIGHPDGRLAEGLTEALASALAGFRWFAVTRRSAPNATFELEGSIRPNDDRLRIAIRLIDAGSGEHLFDHRLDVEPSDLRRAPDEIARRLAGAIEPALLKSAGNGVDGASAQALVRRGIGLFHRVTAPTHLEARALFREACRMAPDLAEAHLWLARVSAGIIGYGWSEDAAAVAAEGVAAGLTAVRLDDANPYAHYGLAIASLYGGAFAQALAAAERSVELNDSFALGHLVLGLARLSTGDAAAAIAPLRRGLDLSPGDPQAFAWHNFLALARLFTGDTSGALATARGLAKSRPDWRPALETLAACEVAAGDLAAARHIAARMAALEPYRGAALSPVLAANPHWAEMLEALVGEAEKA